jgi:ubiquinone biosynthesis protein UbiJ
MLHTLQQMAAPAVMERLTLLLNHVLGSEAVAAQRLRPQAGKVVQIDLQGWPGLLPPPPTLAWCITPAGLLEWRGGTVVDGAELRLTVVADNPALLGARLLVGERPAVEVAGDAQLAADVSWLLQNLRWDLAGDVERVLPAPVAAGLVRAGTALAQGLGAAVQQLESMRTRWQARQGT